MKSKNYAKGWHEPEKNEQGKSPEHQAAALKTKYEGALDTPMKKADSNEQVLRLLIKKGKEGLLKKYAEEHNINLHVEENGTTVITTPKCICLALYDFIDENQIAAGVAED